jgi:hypothetical protein
VGAPRAEAMGGPRGRSPPDLVRARASHAQQLKGRMLEAVGLIQLLACALRVVSGRLAAFFCTRGHKTGHTNRSTIRASARVEVKLSSSTQFRNLLESARDESGSSRPPRTPLSIRVRRQHFRVRRLTPAAHLRRTLQNLTIRVTSGRPPSGAAAVRQATADDGIVGPRGRRA